VRPAISSTATASQKPCGFEAIEIKELSHRLDGVLWPRETTGYAETGSPEFPVVLLEVQMHPDPGFHHRLAAQTYRFLQKHPQVDRPRPHQAAQTSASASSGGALDQPGGTTVWCMNNRSLTIRLDEELEQGLEAACAETGRSRGEIVRDALRCQLQLMRFEQLRRQALPFGEAAGWLTDDDVFAAVS
jgi:predicted transcriptional regulator